MAFTPSSPGAALPAMTQEMIREHDAPSWPRQPAPRGCRRKDRADLWWRCRFRWPSASMVWRGVRIDDVGFTAKRATTGCPVEIPPRIPPAWLERKVGAPSEPMRISSALSSPEKAADAKPAPISTPFTALMLISAAGDVLVELAVERRARARRARLRPPLRPRRRRRSRSCAPRRDRRSSGCDASRIGAEERVALHLVPVPVGAVDGVRADLHQARRAS